MHTALLLFGLVLSTDTRSAMLYVSFSAIHMYIDLLLNSVSATVRLRSRIGQWVFVS